MTTKKVTVGNVDIGSGRPIAVIAGPCVIESRDSALRHASLLKQAADRAGVPYIFKASYDKANRSSVDSYRGPGLIKGLEILAEVKKHVGVPVLTDVHEIGIGSQGYGFQPTQAEPWFHRWDFPRRMLSCMLSDVTLEDDVFCGPRCQEQRTKETAMTFRNTLLCLGAIAIVIAGTACRKSPAKPAIPKDKVEIVDGWIRLKQVEAGDALSSEIVSVLRDRFKVDALRVFLYYALFPFHEQAGLGSTRTDYEGDWVCLAVVAPPAAASASEAPPPVAVGYGTRRGAGKAFPSGAGCCMMQNIVWRRPAALESTALRCHDAL
jgi:hypothetical protein